MRAISENLKNRFEKAQISRTIFAKLMGSSRTVVNRLGLLGLRLSRLTPWNEEESFSQQIAKITKTIPRWGANFSQAKRSKCIRCLRLEISLNKSFRPGLMRSVFRAENAGVSPLSDLGDLLFKMFLGFTIGSLRRSTFQRAPERLKSRPAREIKQVNYLHFASGEGMRLKLESHACRRRKVTANLCRLRDPCDQRIRADDAGKARRAETRRTRIGECG